MACPSWWAHCWRWLFSMSGSHGRFGILPRWPRWQLLCCPSWPTERHLSSLPGDRRWDRTDAGDVDRCRDAAAIGPRLAAGERTHAVARRSVVFDLSMECPGSSRDTPRARPHEGRGCRLDCHVRRAGRGQLPARRAPTADQACGESCHARPATCGSRSCASAARAVTWSAPITMMEAPSSWSGDEALADWPPSFPRAPRPGHLDGERYPWGGRFGICSSA
jgi:hypothetical protein